jgi:hypothetical protein
MQEQHTYETTEGRTWKTGTTSTGISLGAAIAAAISWSIHHSVLWVILHGFFGWLYVIAYVLGIVDQWQE